MFGEKDTCRRYVSVEISSGGARGDLAINIIIYERPGAARVRAHKPLFIARSGKGALDDHQRQADPSIRLSVTCQRARERA